MGVAMQRIGLLLVVLTALLGPAGAAGEGAAGKPIWLVVTRPMFVEAIQPLARKRLADGFEVVVSTQPPSKAIGSQPRRPATAGRR